MIVCDQAGCPAEALRELWFDNDLTLWGCGHHAAQWLPWLTPEVRFDPKPTLIAT